MLLHMCFDVSNPCNRCFRYLQAFAALSVPHDTFFVLRVI